MKKTFLVSDEMLNAFVDNELEGDDHEQIIKLEARQPEVSKAISEKRRLKSMVQSARAHEPEDVATKKIRPGHTWMIAASIVFVFVTLAVFLLPLKGPQNTASLIEFSSNSSYSDSSRLLQAVRDQETIKIVFHLKSKNDHAARALLTGLNDLVMASSQDGYSPQIEVIATGQGLHLFTTNNKVEMSKRIHSILEKYSGVTFVACGKTLEKLQHAEKGELTLLNTTMLVASGKKWIKQRKQQGWSYINI